MRVLKSLFVSVALLLALSASVPAQNLPSAKPADVGLSAERLERITQLLRDDAAKGTIPGAVVMIVRNGKVAYFESTGVLDPETKAPMGKDAIFRIYSMSKPITTVAVMMLFEQGKITLDEPIAKYIPAFKDMKVGVESKGEDGKPKLELTDAKKPITIQDLLRHTSGITYGFFGDLIVKKAYLDANVYEGDYDNAEFAERIAKLPLADPPATRWDYGHSTDVLGRVVEVVSGQTLFQFEKQRLFDPLTMSETAYYVADEAKWPRIARPFPHDRFAHPLVGIKDPTRPWRWESGGAGLVTTIEDYAHFLQMLLNKGSLGGKQYLKPETVALMASDQIGPETGIVHDPFYFPGPTSGFGLGFAVRTTPPPNTTWPLGEYRWDGAGSAFYFVDPVDDMFVVFMVHSPSQGGRIQLALKTLIYEAMGKGLRKD